MADIRGRVLSIQRMSTEDGPGLRTTVFLKGCPLACAWCHNPESLSRNSQVQWLGPRCIAGTTRDGCGACLRACPVGALRRKADGEVLVDRGRCLLEAGGGAAGEGEADCGGACAAACPSGAVEVLGVVMGAEEVARELLKDRAFFKGSDRGGITLSGGEASAQPDFALDLLRRCRSAGVPTALDTCGVAPWSRLEPLLAEVDLVLYDLKEADPDRHRDWTGLDNALVLHNLRRLGDLMASSDLPAALWIRSPIIPGATDREDNLLALGAILHDLALPRLERWELCAFNNLCADKYRRLGRPWAFEDRPLMAADRMEALAEAARRATGGLVEVSWTGATRLDAERNTTCDATT